MTEALFRRRQTSHGGGCCQLGARRFTVLPSYDTRTFSTFQLGAFPPFSRTFITEGTKY